MKILILAGVLLLSGCAAEIAGWRVNSIYETCNTRGGVQYITTLMTVIGTCADGKVIKPKRGR